MILKRLKKFAHARYMIPLIVVACLSLLTLYIYIYNNIINSNSPFTFSSTAMGTYINQTACGKDAQAACKCALDSIKSLEEKLSWRIGSSDVAKLNSSAPHDYIQLSKETFDVLSIALDIAENTNGSFDPTILPLSNLWDFGGINQRLPNINEIKSVLPYINYKSITLDKKLSRVKLLKDNIKLDLGGAGKGSACEYAVNEYKLHDLEYAIISAGGSIGLYGHKKNLEPFKIAIRDPFSNNDTCEFAIFNVASGFISTSGAYERNFTQDNKFYHHILCPKTGYPVENNLMSVTIYHNGNGTLTDVLSTACFVIGKEEALSLLDRYNASAVFVDKNRHVFTTGIFKNNLKITNKKFFIDN